MGVIIRNGIEYSGALSGGGSCDHKIVYLTQEEYDALPYSKLSDDIEYRITNANTYADAAKDWAYDNSNSDLDATNVQDAIDELDESLSILSSNLLGDINKSGVYDSDWNYIRFNNGRAIAWGNASFEVNGYGDVGSLKYFSIGGLDIKFPISFNALIAIPHVVYTSAGTCLQLQLQYDGNAISAVYGVSATNQSATVGFNYIAVGSWK